jgi:hypothetical protein
MEFLITCSRDLLDFVVRQRLLATRPNVEIRQQTRVEEVTGDRHRVTGVRVAGPDGPQALHADLVVDASGRGSRAPQWLSALGLPQVRQEEVDSGLAYATRIFVAPPGATDRFPVVNVQADPSSGQPGKTATILPIEGGRWLVTLSGTKGGNPPADAAEFTAFALQQMRDPIVGRLLATATAVTDVAYTRGAANRRRYFEKLREWPRGFLVIGDAVATYNPIYGQGMSVAAQSALHLRSATNHCLSILDTRTVQKAVCRTGHTPWQVATGQDSMYPGATGTPQPAAARFAQRYFERYIRTALGRPSAARRLYNAFTLSGPISQLMTPAAIADALRGPAMPPLSSAPISAEELARAGVSTL